jgi:hypothetical protein
MNLKMLPLAALACGACGATLDANAEPLGAFVELAHASNGRTTDRNLGRNFIHFGWNFRNEWMLSGGFYVAGEETCFQSATIGRHFARGRWQATWTSHEGGICALDGRHERFEPNSGLCAAWLFADMPLWSTGIGGCLWRQSDYTTGNWDTSQLFAVEHRSPQLTGQLMIRWHPGGASKQ